MKLKMGIVGVGSMGNTHIKNVINGLVKNVEISCLCDIEVDKCHKANADYGLNAHIFTDYKEMIDSKLCDFVFVVTPHYSHPEIAIYALEHDTHVIIEKPAAVYTKQLKYLNELSLSKPNLKFGIMYNQRTNPIYQKAKQLVAEGELGEIIRLNWIITNWYRSNAYYRSGGWRAKWATEGGGVLLNQDPHQLDLLQWIGGMPEKITSFLKFGSRRNIKVEDDVTCYLEYKNGATGVFVSSVVEYPGTNRFEISGTKGQIIIENGKLVFNKLIIDEREFNEKNTAQFGKPEYEKIVFDLSENIWGGQHAELLQNYVNSILNDEELLAPGIEGINGLIISNAMHLSTLKNKTIILDEIESEKFEEELNKLIEDEQNA